MIREVTCVKAGSQASLDIPPRLAGGGRAPRILLFDTQSTGHHISYLAALVYHYLRSEEPVDLIIAAPPSVLESDVVAGARRNGAALILLAPLQKADLDPLDNALSAPVRSLREWRLFQRVCRLFLPDHALAMYFDSLQLGAAVLGGMPCSWSGIYFRARFHYRSLSWDRNCTASIAAELRQLAVLHAAFGRKTLHSLFCLDPLAVTAGAGKGLRLEYCPDPIPRAFEERMTDRGIAQREVPERRKRFLLFGQLSGRKNLSTVVEAIELLPPEIRRGMALCVAGPVESGEEGAIARMLGRLRAAEGLALDTVLRHLSSADAADVLADADLVLLPYRQHIGMSSVLVLASRASKPVIATDYGLLGHLVRGRRLGISIDCSDPRKLAEAFRQALLVPQDNMYDSAACRRLASEHGADCFASVIAKGIHASIS